MDPRRPALLVVAPFASALLASGCERMESSGRPFSPAPRPAAVAPGPAAPDPAFDFPSEPPLVLTSEELARGDLGVAAAAGVDPVALLGEPPPPAAPVAAAPVVLAAPAAPSPAGLPAVAPWPVRLVSTLPQAQPPRAILGLPSGEERVVSPGSILADEGLVVMAVTADRVQLARVEPAGDHARIATIELTAQYPAQ